MKLHKPTLDELPLVISAWQRLAAIAPLHHFRQQILDKLISDPAGYIKELDDLSGGGELTLEDGSKVERLPSISRYMWADGQPAGRISYRWKAGTTKLPAHVLGHIGYETFPWFQKRGFATSALKQILTYPREQKMPYVEITTNVDNFASQKVITNNGGVVVEEFEKPASSGGGKALRYLIRLSD